MHTTLITNLLNRFWYGDECRTGPDLPAEPPTPAPPAVVVDRPRTITSVSAWSGSWTLRHPETSAQRAASMALDRVDLMLSDHSAARSPVPFLATPIKGRRAAPLSDLLRVGRACAAAGVDLGLTTWVMPHDVFVDSLVRYLRDAVEQLEPVCPVRTVILDAEEPWTQAAGASRLWAPAAARLGRGLADLQAAGVRIGLTGIGYAREDALDPLAEWSDVAVPQVYATTTNGLDPRTSPAKFAARWTARFERKALAIGLPAYRQASGMMAAALEGAREVAADPNSAECSEVIYWSLKHLVDSPAKARFVASIKAS